MATWPSALPPSSLAEFGASASLIRRLEALFDKLESNAKSKMGGLTIGKPPSPRKLVYVGPCPTKNDVEPKVREILSGTGFEFSLIRNPEQIKEAGARPGPGRYHTATAENPKGE
jgi:hypothetical protein